MSHIEEMIRELCPNGVEYKKLKNTTTITRGVRVVKSQLQSIGSYPVYQNSLLLWVTMINTIVQLIQLLS